MWRDRRRRSSYCQSRSMSKEKTISDADVSSKAEWTEKILAPHLETETERCAEFTTSSGLPLERVYASEDCLSNGASPGEKLGYPGAYRFTRGFIQTMNRSQFQVVVLSPGFGSG